MQPVIVSACGLHEACSSGSLFGIDLFVLSTVFGHRLCNTVLNARTTLLHNRLLCESYIRRDRTDIAPRLEDELGQGNNLLFIDGVTCEGFVQLLPDFVAEDLV